VYSRRKFNISTLSLGSVFSDCVSFYGPDISFILLSAVSVITSDTSRHALVLIFNTASTAMTYIEKWLVSTFGSTGNGYDNLQAKFQLDILNYSGDMAIVNVLIS